MEFLDLCLKNIKESLLDIELKEKRLFDREKANQYLKKTGKDRLDSIHDTMLADAKSADFFNGIDSGKVHTLVGEAAKISLHHGCTMYAKEIYYNSLTQSPC